MAALGAALLVIGSSCTASVPVNTATMKSFGHSIKNGHLVSNTEIPIFEHECTSPPCTVTQMHCPTAGPRGWDQTVLRIYIDDDATPLTMTMLELANIGDPTPPGATATSPKDPSAAKPPPKPHYPPPGPPGTNDKGPWGVDKFGHTANNGGVYSMLRIPFGSKIRVTLESVEHGTFWFIIRGVEALPVILGDLELPTAARLKFHRFTANTTANELVTLVDIPAGTAGALVNLRFDASSTAYGYLEACMRAMIDGATTPLFLSSGAEDYFLSAYYFNEGQFKTPNSGLTFFDGAGTLSAYKTHDRDPVLWNDGLQLVFRNGEVTTGCGDMGHCPNQFCRGNASALPVFAEHARSLAAAEAERSAVKGPTAHYNTLVWTYEWPKSTEVGSNSAGVTGRNSSAEVAVAIKYVVRLGAAGLVTEAAEVELLQVLATGSDRAHEIAAAAVEYAAVAGAAAMERGARILVAAYLD